MRHRGLLEMIADTTLFKKIYRHEKKVLHLILGVSSEAGAGILEAALFYALEQPLLIVTPDEITGRRAAADLSAFFGGDVVGFCPPREILPFNIQARSLEIVSQRLTVLDGIYSGKMRCVVVPLESLLQKFLPVSVWEKGIISFYKGQKIEREKLISHLLFLGYEREALVEAPGQMAVRGDIVDLFPLTETEPLRIELFDDEIDSLRHFNVETQRSEQYLDSARISPAREVLLTEEARQRGYQKFAEEIKKASQNLRDKGRIKAANNLEKKADEYLEVISGVKHAEALEQFVHLYYPQAGTLFDYFNSEAVVFLEEPCRIYKKYKEIVEQQHEKIRQLLNDGAIIPHQFGGNLSIEELIDLLGSHYLVGVEALPRDMHWLKTEIQGKINARKPTSFMGKIKMLAEEIKYWKKRGYRIVIFTEGNERASRLRELLWEQNVEAPIILDIRKPLTGGQVVISVGNLANGCILSDWKLVIITDAEIATGKKKTRPSAYKRGIRITDYRELREGDYVVHEHQGIGRYGGIECLSVGGIKKDYLVIEYAGKDRLYVPTDQVELVQKYMASEGHVPRLSRLGGAEWKKVKKRVRESVQVMAEELLQLYASRKALKGYAFSPDTTWQQEFEATFPYQETPHQEQAIMEIKEKMESSQVMDCLLCGDVGYGKTEVALRAAFKAVMDSKQVAVLVPTTILAQQHYHTFKERCESFPINIEVLSRFRTPCEQSRIIKDLKDGKIDIVIGTHRLLSDDLKFKDQGLIIVDEEQRFGVAHKEKLKKMKKNVDVLTLTATPIPRTLQMSLVGMRDMSLIETPPQDRYPVQTYVLEFNSELIKDAIQREIARNGQVYFVHNRIEDIERVAGFIKELLPGVRVAVGHGQMREDDLEQVMLDFMAGNSDVLVCTTIVENGLDIPNVNTLIVDEADRMGLSQLYQLRGRVGRTNRLAYAYFTYRKDKVISEVAEKRLAAIRDFTEFGSGFKIAMRDLEIRGAGNLLGPEQHGHMLAVGFDLYCRLLEEAVQDLKIKYGLEGVDKEQLFERKQEGTSIELNVDTYIDDTYINETGLKMEIYQRLRKLKTLEEVKTFSEEIRDRYGKISPAVNNLLSLARIRILAEIVKARSVEQKNKKIWINFDSDHCIKGEKLMVLAQHFPRQLTFSAVKGLSIGVSTAGLNQRQLLDLIDSIFSKINLLMKDM